MDKRKDVISNAQGASILIIIAEWGFMAGILIVLLLIYWACNYIVTHIVLSGINKIFKIQELKKQIEYIKEQASLEALQKKVQLSDHLINAFEFVFKNNKKKGPNYKIVIDKN